VLKTIKKTLVGILRSILPNRMFWIFKNLYNVSILGDNEFMHFIEVNRKNYKAFIGIQDEFERLKQRAIITDGKLNYLLYGKAVDRSGSLDFQSITPSKNIEQKQNDISIKSLVRGPSADLKERYSKRLKTLTSKAVIDAAFLENKEYIDLGAGSGVVTEVFQNTFGFKKVTGVDSFSSCFEEESLKQFQCINSDVVSFIGFTDQKASFVSAVHVLEHLSLSDQYYFLKKSYELLEPGGYLYIEMPNIYNYRTAVDLFWADEHHLRMYPLTAFRTLAEKLGFVPVCGVYDSKGDFKPIEDYLNSNNFFDREYTDLFLSLRKP
jgi:2-polyprenyl-3-methyl-5-hydroxy-6-metoxy-1,4-benzoquinol methylase